MDNTIYMYIKKISIQIVDSVEYSDQYLEDRPIQSAILCFLDIIKTMSNKVVTFTVKLSMRYYQSALRQNRLSDA